MTDAFTQGFIAKLAELEKIGGPSLRDKANAGVPGAAAKLKAQEEAKAYRKKRIRIR